MKKKYQAYRTERCENRSLLVESSSSSPSYAILFLCVCLIISVTGTFSADPIHDTPEDIMVVTRVNGYYLVAATETANQRNIRLRHDKGSADRQLVTIADFNDPKSVVLKNQYNEVTSVQPPLQLRGTPSSLNDHIEQNQQNQQPMLVEQPQEYFQGAATSQSAAMQTYHQQKEGNDYYTQGSTPSELDRSYVNTAKFLPEDSIRNSPEINSGVASTPMASMRGTDIKPLQTAQSQQITGIINEDASKLQLIQNQQLMIQHPLQYSQGTITSKASAIHEVNESKDKLLLQGPTTATFQTATKLTDLESHPLQLPGQKSGLQHPSKYSQTYMAESEQNQLYIRPPEFGNNNSSQRTATVQVAQGHSNGGHEGDVNKLYQEQALNYQSTPQVFSKSEVGAQNVLNMPNVNAISVPQERSQRPTVQTVPQSSQVPNNGNVIQTILGQEQLLKAQTFGNSDELSQSQTPNKNQATNLAIANNPIQPPVNFGLEGFRDTWDLPLQINDLPVFWKIPRSGGQTVVDILGQCHRFVMATEAGNLDGHGQDSNITVRHIAGDGGGATSYVNVDTTTTLGLQRAKRLGLVQSEIARVIVVKNIFEANELFDESHRGRLFALFRHPVDRAISTYNYLKYADWEPTYDPEIADMTLKQYAQSKHAEFNWMTNALSSAGTRNVTEEHLKAAMDVVRRKFLVGLLNRKDESMERFEKYFEWIYRVHPKNQEKCRVGLLAAGTGSNINPNKVEKPLPGTPTYQLLVALNEFDIRLYKYVESLFDEQANFVKLKEDGFRLDGASCCKCDKSC